MLLFCAKLFERNTRIELVSHHWQWRILPVNQSRLVSQFLFYCGYQRPSTSFRGPQQNRTVAWAFCRRPCFHFTSGPFGIALSNYPKWLILESDQVLSPYERDVQPLHWSTVAALGIAPSLLRYERSVQLYTKLHLCKLGRARTFSSRFGDESFTINGRT